MYSYKDIFKTLTGFKKKKREREIGQAFESKNFLSYVTSWKEVKN